MWLLRGWTSACLRISAGSGADGSSDEIDVEAVRLGVRHNPAGLLARGCVALAGGGSRHEEGWTLYTGGCTARALSRAAAVRQATEAGAVFLRIEARAARCADAVDRVGLQQSQSSPCRSGRCLHAWQHVHLGPPAGAIPYFALVNDAEVPGVPDRGSQAGVPRGPRQGFPGRIWAYEVRSGSVTNLWFDTSV